MTTIKEKLDETNSYLLSCEARLTKEQAELSESIERHNGYIANTKVRIAELKNEQEVYEGLAKKYGEESDSVLSMRKLVLEMTQKTD